MLAPEGIQQYMSTGDVKVEVYFPKNDNVPYHFDNKPDKVYYLGAARPSNNRDASFWYAFNIILGTKNRSFVANLQKPNINGVIVTALDGIIP